MKTPNLAIQSENHDRISSIFGFMQWLESGDYSQHTDKQSSHEPIFLARFMTDEECSEVIRDEHENSEDDDNKFGDALMSIKTNAEVQCPIRVRKTIESLVYEYFGIDPREIENERRDVLDNQRKTNEERTKRNAENNKHHGRS